MMFLHALTDFLRKRFVAKTPQPRPFTRLRLEELEDRVVPSFMTNTYTNASVQISPGFTVTETVTATVTPFQGFNFGTGQITPIPAGATAPTSGTVLFNLNNQMQSATLNANGQATATFQIPLLAFLTSQTLAVSFQGTTDTSGDAWFGSAFLAPLYRNFDNVIFPSTLNFNQLTPQQVFAQEISEFQSGPPNFTATTLNPFSTAQGETNTVAGGLITFNYVDPGTINTVGVLGFQLPGSFAIQLGAFNGLTSSSSSS